MINLIEASKEELIEEIERLRGIIAKNKVSFIALQTRNKEQRHIITKLEANKPESETDKFMDMLKELGITR